MDDLRKDMKRLILDVALIKSFLIEDGELTEQALEELENSRNIPISECVPQNKVREMILAK